MLGTWLAAYRSWRTRREEAEQKKRLLRLNIPTISFDSERIAWEFPDGDTRSLQWNNIALIGYVTYDVGPWQDDWYLVFIDHAGRWHWACLCSAWPGAEILANHVNQMDGVVLGEKGTLVNSTKDDSVVVWPAERAGETLSEE